MNFNCIYLHGFASDSNSFKAQFFKEKFKSILNIDLQTPDLNIPSFNRMLVSEQLKHIRDKLSDTSKNILIGSSLGGFLAILMAELYEEHIEKIFVIAPALNMGSFTLRNSSNNFVTQWKKIGTTEISHSNEIKKLHYTFIEDLLRHEKESYQFKTHCIVFHGTQDENVPISMTDKYLKYKENCTIIRYDSDHLLHDKLNDIWEIMKLEFNR